MNIDPDDATSKETDRYLTDCFGEYKPTKEVRGRMDYLVGYLNATFGSCNIESNISEKDKRYIKKKIGLLLRDLIYSGSLQWSEDIIPNVKNADMQIQYQ